jgi:hypothetical protein
MKITVFFFLMSHVRSFQRPPRLQHFHLSSNLQSFNNKKPDADDALSIPYIPLTYESIEETYSSEESEKELDIRSTMNVVLPFLFPFFAFETYDEVAALWEFCVETLFTKSWVTVDGGAYQARIIAPAVNGVVVPAMAVLFATLTSTTISSLRDRQHTVHRSINLEAGELRALECVLEEFPTGNLKRSARNYLVQYTSRLISESSPRESLDHDFTNPRRNMDSELNGLISLLNRHVREQDQKQTTETIPPHILSEVYSSVTKLRDHRHNRITALQSYFPPLHYAVLGVLALSECIAFLMETNQEILVFLNAFQLRILWSMLTSTFVACFALFSDLNSPFSGSYSIATSADQLRTIRITLNASARQEEREAEKNGKEHVTVETQRTFSRQVKNITTSGTGTNGSEE